MRLNKYLPFALLYLFFNSLGLPFGLTYTTLLTPLFYIWIVQERKIEPLLLFLAFLAPIMVLHLINGVDVKAYFISLINYCCVYIFCHAFYTFLLRAHQKETIFENLLKWNFGFSIVAVLLYFTAWQDITWMTNNISENMNDFKRLKLFTYEASHYAVMFTPLFFFFAMQLLLKQNRMNSFVLIIMLLLPYLLSFSLGVLGCVIIAFAVLCLTHFSSLLKQQRVRNLAAMLSLISLFGIFILILLPENPLTQRVLNIIAGTDTSGNGRTYEAFILAQDMIKLKSEAWGIGIGQIKILGDDIIRSFYMYEYDFTNIAIPNAMAETLAIFGWVGFFIRLCIELILFFLTRVYTNYFRFSMFLFVFCYQFTGSYITNIAEYVIWILAFTNVFPQFDIPAKKINSEIFPASLSKMKTAS